MSKKISFEGFPELSSRPCLYVARLETEKKSLKNSRSQKKKLRYLDAFIR